MQIKTIKTPAATSTLLAAAVLAGCGTTGRQVTDNERDTTGAYDGLWLVEVQDTRNTRQTIGNWILSCDGMAWQFNVRVNDGVMRTNIDDAEHTTNVSADGDFLLVVPTAFAASEAATSSATIQRGDITLFINGSLAGDNPSGSYRSGIEEFANNGCRTTAKFVKQ